MKKRRLSLPIKILLGILAVPVIIAVVFMGLYVLGLYLDYQHFYGHK